MSSLSKSGVPQGSIFVFTLTLKLPVPLQLASFIPNLITATYYFNISALFHSSLAGTTPVYLADDCTLVTATGCYFLRSADN